VIVRIASCIRTPLLTGGLPNATFPISEGVQGQIDGPETCNNNWQKVWRCQRDGGGQDYRNAGNATRMPMTLKRFPED
jgi:hypothetical protein